ncbi:MAG: hypothetical protein IPH18_15870 [Chitinophagaceae bacterium]|nr:hypothetical protein [Chitinophagaceae bacterium]
MRKTKYISILGGLGFLIIQAAKATEIDQNASVSSIVTSDTTGKTDSGITDDNDPKIFSNLLHSAYSGDGVTGAKLNPMGVSFVQNYITKNKKGFLAMKDWAKPYFDMMDDVLTQHGVPKEMKYLAVIESGLKYNAKSWSGACGPGLYALRPFNTA